MYYKVIQTFNKIPGFSIQFKGKQIISKRIHFFSAFYQVLDVFFYLGEKIHGQEKNLFRFIVMLKSFQSKLQFIKYVTKLI